MDRYIKDITIDGLPITETPKCASCPLTDNEIKDIDKFDDNDYSFDDAVNCHINSMEIKK